MPRNVIRTETRALRGEAYRMPRSAPVAPDPRLEPGDSLVLVGGHELMLPPI